MLINYYSIHTERSYCNCIKRYVLFNKMKSRDDLNGGEAKIEQFLTYLALGHKDVATTMIYTHVLE
ncbi:MAG: hypothetical protein HQK72_08545 [Desulfamplus sp.]|nr:hypothetical protein [Desulfamplus sp.]